MAKLQNRRHFASDNYSGVHPQIMKALEKANEGHAAAYGDDAYTKKAEERFQKLFGDVEVFFVFNGTAANVLSLKSMIDPHEAVICSSKAHIQEDECGAPEHQLGCKLVLIPSSSGKITPDEIKKVMILNGDQHKIQTRAISITQSTEMGRVYTPKELDQNLPARKKE